MPDGIKLALDGLKLVDEKKYDAAVVKFNSALTAESRNRKVWLKVGMGLFKMGRYAAAMLGAYRARGNGLRKSYMHGLRSQNIKAIDNLQDGAQNHIRCQNPYKGKIASSLDLDYGGIQHMLNLSGLLHEIPACVMRVPGLNPPPKFALALCQEGHNLVLASNYDAAVLKYNEAIAAEPGNCQMYLEVARGLFTLGRYAAAVHAAEYALGNGLSSITQGANLNEINVLYETSQNHLKEYNGMLHKGTLYTTIESQNFGGIQQLNNDAVSSQLNQREINLAQEKAKKKARRKEKKNNLVSFGITVVGNFFVPFVGSAISSAVGATNAAIAAGINAAASGAVDAAAQRKNIAKGVFKGIVNNGAIVPTVMKIVKSKKPAQAVFKQAINSVGNSVGMMVPVATPSIVTQVVKPVMSAALTSTADAVGNKTSAKKFLKNVAKNTVVKAASDLGGNISANLSQSKKEKKPASSTRSMQSKLQKSLPTHISPEKKPVLNLPLPNKHSSKQYSGGFSEEQLCEWSKNDSQSVHPLYHLQQTQTTSSLSLIDHFQDGMKHVALHALKKFSPGASTTINAFSIVSDIANRRVLAKQNGVNETQASVCSAVGVVVEAGIDISGTALVLSTASLASAATTVPSGGISNLPIVAGTGIALTGVYAIGDEMGNLVEQACHAYGSTIMESSHKLFDKTKNALKTFKNPLFPCHKKR